MIDGILLWYINFMALSTHFSAEKLWSSTLNIDQWIELDIKFKLGLKAERKWELRFARQVLSEIFKAKLTHNNVKVNLILIRLRVAAF